MIARRDKNVMVDLIYSDLGRYFHEGMILKLKVNDKQKLFQRKGKKWSFLHVYLGNLNSFKLVLQISSIFKTRVLNNVLKFKDQINKISINDHHLCELHNANVKD